jgi:hypothetical protein
MLYRARVHGVACLTISEYRGLHRLFGDVEIGVLPQYLRQLRKAAGGLRGMNTAQAGDLVENLAS